MRRFVVSIVLGLAPLAAAVVVQGQSAAPPAWAYAIPPAPPAGAPAAAAAPVDNSVKQLPGSSESFTLTQIRDRFGPADWFPSDHPVMPDVVRHGKQPDVWACSLCHYPNGKGRQENAGVAGLNVSYFIQTMNDFKNGLRKSAEPRKGNTNLMIAIAKGMTDQEIAQAAQYCGAMKWTPWIRVVEASTVRKMRSAGGIWVPIEGCGAGADWNADHRDAGKPRAYRALARSAVGIHRVCAARERQEGRGARHDRRQRQDDGLRHVPRS